MEAAPVLSVDAKREEIERHVKALQSGDADGQEAAENALIELADQDNANCTAIAQRLVGLISGGSADDQEKAAKALGCVARWRLDTSDWAANRAAIVEAGGIEALVALLSSGAAGGQAMAAAALCYLAADYKSDYRDEIVAAGGIEALVALVKHGAARGQDAGVGALGWLANNVANRVAIVEAGAIPPLVELVRSGAARGQGEAARVLRNLAEYAYLAEDAAIHVAIVAAGGVEALSALLANGPDTWGYAQQALKELGPLAEYASQLQSENASLKRRLGEEDVVDLRDDGAPPPAKKNALRDEHDRATQARLVQVKEEKVAAEGARDRTDAVAAAASADAAGAASELEDAQELAGHLYQSENNKMSTIDELRGTVSERDARIEALEAEVAELREQLRGGGRAKRPRT